MPRKRSSRPPGSRVTPSPPVVPPGSRLFVLSVPYLERGIAAAHGARWDAFLRATIFIGPALPPGLRPYGSPPFSWERWQEDDLNGTPGATPRPQAGLTPRPHQREAASAIANAARIGARGFLLADDVGLGKAQPLNSLVLTTHGFKRMGDITVGEEVVNPDGGVAKVLAVYPQGVRPVFRIALADGSSVRCDENHLWAVHAPERSNRGNAPLIKTTRELMDDMHVNDGSAKWYITPMPAAPNLDCGEYRPLDPYLLAVLLCDGHITHGSTMFSTSDEEIVQRVENALPGGVHVVKANGYDWRISRNAASGPDPMKSALQDLGLWESGSATEFVPRAYLESPVNARLAVIQGLMDTGGSITERGGHLAFTCISEQLSNDVAWLVRSLGGYARVTEQTTWDTTKSEQRKDGRKAFRVSISNLPPEIEPFRLRRKADLYRPPTRRINLRAIVDITPDGEEPTQCILLDSENHLYLTDNFTVTHNTVSALEGVLALSKHRTVQNVLIVTPLAVVPHWRRTVADLGLPDHGIRVCVINYDRLKKLLEVPVSAQAAKRTRTKNKRIAKEGTSLVPWDVIIFDESHKIRNSDSQRRAAAERLAQYSASRADAPFVIWASATAGQSPVEISYLWPLLAQLTKTPANSFRKFGPWLQEHGFHVVHEPRFDRWTWTDNAEERARDIQRMRSLLFERKTPVALRRIPENISGWPEIIRTLLPVDLAPDEYRLYNEAWTAFRQEMHLARKGKDPKAGMVARLRFRQKASLLRVSGTVEYALDLLENGHQVAISVQFLETLDHIAHGLEKAGVTVAILDGRNPHGREDERLRFQRGEAKVVLFTPVEGFSLHSQELLSGGQRATQAPRSTIIHDARFSGIEAIQIEGRCHRDGQAANVYYAFGADTVEEQIVRTLLSRVEATKSLVGDDTATLRALEAILDGN